MKVAVFGNRSINDPKIVYPFIDELAKIKADHLVFLHGGARGPQKIITEWAFEQGITNIILFKPWHMIDDSLEFTTELYFLRNVQIVDNADLVVLITNGERDSEVDRVRAYALRKNVETLIIEV